MAVNRSVCAVLSFWDGPTPHPRVAPGITLAVTVIDVSRGHATGCVRFAADNHPIWFRNQSTQEPVVFYGATDGKKRELVITRVTKSSTVGYLLLPKAGATAITSGD